MRDFLNLLGSASLLGGLVSLAAAEEEPGEQPNDRQRADDGADSDASDGTLGQATAARRARLRILLVILLIVVIRARGREAELLGRDVEAGGLDVEVGHLDESLCRG